MWVPTVNQIRQNYGTVTEKLAFECDQSFSRATANLCRQNPCTKSEIIFVNIPYCTILLLTVSGIPYCMCLSVKCYWISYIISSSLV